MNSDLRPQSSVAPKAGVKPDPYATPAHKAINALLIAISALLMLVVFQTAAAARRNQDATSTVPSSQSQSEQSNTR